MCLPAMAVAAFLRALHPLCPWVPPLRSAGAASTSGGFHDAFSHVIRSRIEISEHLSCHFSSSGKTGLSKPPIAVIDVTSGAHFGLLMAEAKAKREGLAVVSFTSRTSNSCRFMSRAFNFLSTQYHDIMFLKIDFDKPELQATLKAAHVTEVPTFQVYKKGKVIAQMTGQLPDKLKEMVEGSRFYAKYRKK